MGQGSIRYSGGLVDMTPRFWQTTTVAASPSAGVITAIASLLISGDSAICSGVWLTAQAAFTAGTAAVTALLEIRETSTTGTLIASSGLVTVVATKLFTQSIQGFDTAAVTPGQVYKLCLTMGSGSATSTVSSLQLAALVI